MSVARLLGRPTRLFRWRYASGYIDHFDRTRVAGWAINKHDPLIPAQLSLHADGAPLLNIVADLPRRDVHEAGLAALDCGFDVALPRQLRDGKAHYLELRREPAGTVLRGGSLTIPADPNQADGPSICDTTEGVAYYEKRRVAISGWATGCHSVRVEFGDGQTHIVPLSHEIAGFGHGMRRGFCLFVPRAFRDGAWHEAAVHFESTDVLLDGAPVRFRALPDQPIVDIVRQSGRHLALQLQDGQRKARTAEVAVLADGVPVCTQQVNGQCHLTLPDNTQNLIVAKADKTPLARFAVAEPKLMAPLPLTARYLVNKPLAAEQAGPSLPPVLTPERHPRNSIYAAWLSRLSAPGEMLAEIDLNEALMQADLTSKPLADAPLVSIIMPSWNRAFAIAEAIQSVLEQSYSNWELLIADDASEDRTAEVVRAFDDPRIRYMKFLKSNGAGARNKALRFARGNFIAYLDSDNIWHPLFLDMMLRQLQSNPASGLAYSAYLDTEIEGASVNLRAIPRDPA